MKLCGQDYETILAVSTMSCLWKLIKFSVIAGDRLKEKRTWCKDVFLRYASPHVRMCMFTVGQITGRSSQARRKDTSAPRERSPKITATVCFDFEDGYNNRPPIRWTIKRQMMRKKGVDEREKQKQTDDGSTRRLRFPFLKNIVCRWLKICMHCAN